MTLAVAPLANGIECRVAYDPLLRGWVVKYTPNIHSAEIVLAVRGVESFPTKAALRGALSRAGLTTIQEGRKVFVRVK